MPATFEDLIQLMQKLRAPGGCPWDREQTYATLAPMLLEEAYEAFEAVEEARSGHPHDLRDELGDLLFQIVFYAQVAEEQGHFSINDVTSAIHEKMVRRHPHVFGEIEANDTATVLRNWETMKQEERWAAGKSAREDSLLDGVSAKAPALMEAHQLSTKAARVGFDWQQLEDIFAKLEEEVGELRAGLAGLERRLTSLLVSSEVLQQTLRVEAVAIAAYAFGSSLAQRTLSTPVRRARREHGTTEGVETLERALRLLTWTSVALAVALVAARLR